MSFFDFIFDSLHKDNREIRKLLVAIRVFQDLEIGYLREILSTLTPPKATRLGLSLGSEPLEIPEMDQFHYQTEGCFAHLSPNGTVDEAPLFTVSDPGTSVSVDPDGMTAHFRGTSPGIVTVSVTAKVDNPATPELETISETAQFEWLAPETPKATVLGLSFGSEPLS